MPVRACPGRDPGPASRLCLYQNETTLDSRVRGNDGVWQS
jgi:hypothetical protein